MTLPAGFVLDPVGSAPPDLLAAQEQQESQGNQNAVSPKGAFGVMQLMPATARDPGFGVKPLDPNAPDPEAENRRLGTDYMNALLTKYGGDENKALIAYNWGPTKTDRWIAAGADMKRLPRETQQYVAKIQANRQPQAMMLGPSDQPYDAAQEAPPPGLPPGFVIDAPAPQQAAPEKPYQPTPWGDIADDAMNSFISRGVGAAVGLAGLPGDALNAVQGLDKYLGTDKYDPAGVSHAPNPLPTSESISNMQTPIGRIGDAMDYTPKTGAGELAGDIAGYGVSGAGLGTKSLLQGAAQVAGTAGAANVGRELGGTPGEIVAGLAASHGLTRPTVMGKAPAVTEADRVTAAADDVMQPATAAVQRVSQEAYKAADAAGVVVKGTSFANLLRSFRADPALDGLKIPGAAFQMAPRDMNLSEFDDVRKKALKIAMRDPDPNKRRLAGIVVDRMDKFLDSPSVIASGDVGAGKAALQAARYNWKIYRKSADLDAIMEVARDRAGQYSVSGNENAIRTGFRQLSMRIARDKRVRNLYTRDEIKVIRQLSRGGHLRDLSRGIGAVLNNRFVQGVGGLGVGGAQAYSLSQGQGIDPWSILLGAAGFGLGKGARGLSGALAKGKANQLSKLIRSGGQLSASPGAVNSLPLAGTLLGARSGNQ